MYHQITIGLVALLLAGCVDSAPTAPKPKKTTDKIGEFDPNAGKKVVKPEVKITNPITGPLEAYGPIVQKVTALGIEQLVNVFNATEGRYPNSYEEFMTRVIKENKIQLPTLPPGLEYQYDVENHKLVVIQSGDAKAP